MKILGEYGREDVAKVYVGSLRDDEAHVVEFVESLQPPIPRNRKWVLIVSSSFGCPMRCLMCDAGGRYFGRLEVEDILAQTDHMVFRRFPDGKVLVEKFKVQFARMGEPSLNPSVIDALALMPGRYDAPGLMTCVSTVAPEGAGDFFGTLARIKEKYYGGGRFQIQFSVHTTDQEKRDWLIPGRKWDLDRISSYGDTFFKEGDRKLTLNFAMTRGLPIEPQVIARHFDPDKFVVKLTPLNPTANGKRNGLVSAMDPTCPKPAADLLREFQRLGFETILSVGELEENKIGSNCGQYVSLAGDSGLRIKEGYETLSYRIA